MAVWIRQLAADTLQPRQVERMLLRMAEKWPADQRVLRQVVEEFPLGPGPLLHLLSVSSICATRLERDPQTLLWLQHPDVCDSQRGHGRMMADLRRFTSGPLAAENFRALREWKGREMLRIALREVAEVAPLEETTAELSQLAEICVQQVLKHWDAELRARFGSPQAELAVLGLGKLGGRELNHSSDIDVIFLYTEEGQLNARLSHHEFFNRLVTKVAETFSANDAAGSLFRIDLRLRPEGTAGPMARSLESMENYYSGYGETWERLALSKARSIAGDQELAYDFLRQHQPFIYPKSPTPELLDEIAAIKRRIERDIVGHENLDRNVKLGTGGIREIEFVVQALQLLHGARQPFLQETSTLKVLPGLAELELLPREEAIGLEKAYRFLRRVEHRLQIESEQQTHTVPQDREAASLLARSLGFAETPALMKALRGHMQEVRTVFARIISAQPHDQPLASANLDMFRDQAQAMKTLTELAQGRVGAHMAPRTRQIFRNLRPMLLEVLAQCADPDATLTQLVRFVEAYGLRSALFELLAANPRLLELLVKTFDASRYAADVLIRRPQLLEEVTRAGALDRGVSVSQHLAALRATAATRQNFEPVRHYRQAQTLRILLRDVLGLADVQALTAEHSALAEACLIFVQNLVAPEGDLTIIALGKFGGGELSYGADLDVTFVGENTRAAQELLVEMGKATAEGTIAAVDPRLRPDGEKGTLTCSLATFESYYATRAQLWEVQALTRARAVCGKEGAAFIELAQRTWRAIGQRENLFAQIDAMRERIRRDRGTGVDILDYKTGLGGMVEAEFLVQAVQMRAGIWNPHFHGALQELVQHGVVSAERGEALRTSYDFLRRCESVLRRMENKGVAALPRDEAQQRKLAQRLGFASLEEFGTRYREAREAIHVVYVRYLE
ncbi:bifunctional [glutamate--ammonia ligase]-adenylyl-L-tyrosine phosphorylase/[glutamate--ammonia-ligase] adenylyltransferase [soil metagenome]|nr:bifunctional [glutamate--ammonia ligase]-adenylyl-L-tyrosine phosphorylase/[glutamate--ammonia-ligase] adenylyltransferase [Chthoniobacterales bacterium]